MRTRLPVILLVLAACQTAGGARVTSADRARVEAEARRVIANELQLDVATIPASAVGVAPLSVVSADSALRSLGYGLADLIMVDLARSQQITVVDRLRLDVYMRELQRGQTHLVDASTAPRLGQLIGARRLVLGSVIETPGRDLVISTRVADAVTSEIPAPITASASLDRILDAQKAMSFQILDQLGVTLTPAERATIEQRATQNLAALLAYSRGVRYEAEGDYSSAAREFQTAVQLDPTFARASTRLGVSRALSMPAGPTPLARVTAVASERINQPLVPTTPAGPRTGTAVEPIPSSTVRILVTITTPP